MALSPLCPVGVGSALDTLSRPSQVSAGSDALGPFASVIKQYLEQANALATNANQQVLDLATGKADNIHDVMLASAKADLAFRMVLQVRNRLTDAYQEITRMSV